jgi:hypothetical protein
MFNPAMVVGMILISWNSLAKPNSSRTLLPRNTILALSRFSSADSAFFQLMIVMRRPIATLVPLCLA